jgi:signal transduction histidine kinase
LVISTGQLENAAVTVTVQDSGPGLAPADLERVFDAFYTSKPGGLGMGLSICHSIIAAHGGCLSAAKAEPWGAIFQFSIPIKGKNSDADVHGGNAPTTSKIEAVEFDGITPR